MRTLEIMSGFKDIKRQFELYCPEVRTVGNLRLWFSIKQDGLYVHNYKNHSQQMLIVRVNEKNFANGLINLEKNSSGRNLIQWALKNTKSKKTGDVAKILNDEFTLCGSFII
jgi:hypothetical protein